MAACGAGRGNWLLGFDPPFAEGPEMLIAVPWQTMVLPCFSHMLLHNMLYSVISDGAAGWE